LKTATYQSERGFSLVEILIAMTLGLILISSMIAVFSGNKRSSELNSATADLQESARYALEQMSRDARMAGFMGCIDVNSSDAIRVNANNPPTNDVALTATTGAVIVDKQIWEPAFPGYALPTVNEAKPGTNALMLQYGSADTTELAQEMTIAGLADPGAPVTAFAGPDIAAGDLAIISNCDHADLFHVTGALTGGGGTVQYQHSAAQNIAGAFERAYGSITSIEETRVMKFHSNIYYVGENGQENENGDLLYSLYQQSLPYDPAVNPPVELVTGVENMRISFGVRNPDTGGIQFVPADDPVFNPQLVNSIRFGLLMVSYDEVAEVDDTNTYMLAGQPILAAGAGVPAEDSHPKDRRIRLAFNTMIQVRNKKGL